MISAKQIAHTLVKIRIGHNNLLRIDLVFQQRHGVPMAIASNGLGKGYGHDVLEKFHLADYFEVELFREDIQKSKPHPDAILRAMRAMKKPPAAGDVVWFIGDRHKDMIAGLEADKLSDYTVMPFSYGLNAAVALLKNQVDTEHIIVSYPDFYERVRDLFGDDNGNVESIRDAA